MTAPPAWHQALAYAVTGRRFPELGHQASPDLAAVVAFVERELAAGLDRGLLTDLHPLPADLAAGVGAAQLAAAAAEVRRRLGVTPGPGAVIRERALTADERRLLQDVPPHHGS